MHHERLLVVDDEPSILKLCHRILESHGYDVVDAKRGEDALAMLDAGNFDLILTDIRLPGLTGLEVAQRLRERGHDLAVVTMTGYSNMDMAIQALSLGVDEFIVKPFTPDSLRVTVARALEKRRLERENTRLRSLLPLFETARGFSDAQTQSDLNAQLLNAATKLLASNQVALFLTDGDSNRLTLALSQGAKWEFLGGESFLREDLSDFSALKSGQVITWREREAPRRLPIRLEIEEDAMLMCAPLAFRDELDGILVALADDNVRGFTPGDAEALGIITGQATVAMRNIRLLEEISQAYVSLRELDRLKSEFINIAAHEIRTPLSILLGYAYLLVDNLGGSAREQMQMVIDNAERLRHVADDMLSLKYLETGEVELRLESCILADAVDQVVDAYEELGSEKDQRLIVRGAQDAGVIVADRAMLDLMLGNLVSNAIKFSPYHSQIDIEASGAEHEVVICVRDQGRGLTPLEQIRIFEAFYQTGPTLTRSQNGLGLGLTLTREMALAHGGRIWVESEINAGSTFFLALPRHAEMRQTNSHISPPRLISARA